MVEDEAPECGLLDGVVLVPFDARPLPSTRLAYAEEIRRVQTRAREIENEHAAPQP